MTTDYKTFELFERTLDLVCIVDKPGRFIKVNPAVATTLGYSPEELYGLEVFSLLHPDDREMTTQKRNDLLENKPLRNFQNRYLTKNGSVVWLEWTSVYIPEKEVVFAIAKDITSRKMVEIEIEENYKKYKGLAAHFKQHVEKDREFFAVELHEELAQLATVIRMQFESVARACDGAEEPLQKAVERGVATTELLINKLRRLSYSMNPARIEELGLDAVIQSLCNEFGMLTKIPCRYASSFDESLLDYEMKLDLLRICQEALLNVMHHAQATDVKISLQQIDNKIELSVIDNGKGFEHQSRQSFGLKKMQGRAASMNGELLIESATNKGTRVSVSVDTKK